ncbi:MAG: LamG domain-containing protein [Pirellulales bacterium]
MACRSRFPRPPSSSNSTKPRADWLHAVRAGRLCVHTPVYSPLDEFFHLVFVKDDSAVRAYVNGTLAGTRFDPISLYRYQIGDESGESPFASLDDVVIYDRALSPTEIADHFAAIPEPSTLALVMVVLGAGCLRRS